MRFGSLLVIDADHFKLINDNLGHQTGDEALKLIASSIKGSLRDADIVGRIGGEEFGVFLPGAEETDASQVAERIRSTISSAVFPEAGNRYNLTVSVGGVSFRRRASFDELFSTADSHLYRAKANGRNQVAMTSL